VAAGVAVVAHILLLKLLVCTMVYAGEWNYCVTVVLLQVSWKEEGLVCIWGREWEAGLGGACCIVHVDGNLTVQRITQLS
jgi:hypothetical protein